MTTRLARSVVSTHAKKFVNAELFSERHKPEKNHKNLSSGAYDQRFPLVHSEGDVKIVWPESVLMVIEVKTNMSSTEDLRGAIENIVSVKQTILRTVLKLHISEGKGIRKGGLDFSASEVKV